MTARTGQPSWPRAGRWFAVLLTAVLVTTVGTVMPTVAQAAPQQSGTPPVVLILDASGSMVRESGGGRTRMDDAKAAVTSTLTALPATAGVGVLVFGTQTGNSDAERTAGCNDVRLLAEVSSTNRSDVVREIQSIHASGFTPIGLSLRKAAELVGHQKGRIILVSDGVETCAPPPSCSVASDLRAANADLVIDVVGFAVDDDEEAQQQLTCISGAGGGQYVSAADAAQLAARLGASANLQRTRSSLSGYGARNVGLGMSLNEVLTVVGADATVKKATIDGVIVVTVDCSWATIELRNGAVVSITPTADIGTAEGLQIGDQIGEVEAVYGQPVDTGSDSRGPYRTFAAGRGDAGYRVYLDGSTVKLIVVCRCSGPPDTLSSLATWEATFDGVGPLHLGMTVEEATQAVAKLTPKSGPKVLWVESPTGGVVAHFNTSGRIFAIAVLSRAQLFSPAPGELVAAGATLPHASGQRLGAPVATTRTAFPGGTTVRVEAAGLTYYVVSDRRGRSLQLHTWDETVAGMVVYDFVNADGASGSPLDPPWSKN